MRGKFTSIFKNEKGNIGLFVLGMLGIMMIMFVFVMNLGSILTTKEESNKTSTQASMAASSKLYEIVRNKLADSDYPKPSPDDPNYGEKIQVYDYFQEYKEDPDLLSRINSIKILPQYKDWSFNELKLEALDKYLVEGFNGIDLLVEELTDLLSGSVDHDVIRTAIDTIKLNNGELKDAFLEIKKDKKDGKERIHIIASNQFESISYKGLIDNYEENIMQESAGPKIDFIQYIWTARSRVDLEYYDSLHSW
jgi:hypothetical protein